jgi:hypothetical protein
MRWFAFVLALLSASTAVQAQFNGCAPGLCNLASIAGAPQFVGAAVFDENTHGNTGAGSIVWPSGTVAGDQAIILLFGDSASITLTGTSTFVNDWPTSGLDGGSVTAAYHTASIASADISIPPTFSGIAFGGYEVIVYSGGAGVNFGNSVQNNSGTTTPVPGFTKGATSSIVVGVAVSESTAQAYVAPSGFADRENSIISFFACDMADIASGSYTNGTTVTFTGIASSASTGGLWEIVH